MRSKTSRNRYRFHSRTRTRCRAPTPPSCRSPIGSRSAGAPAQQAADPTSQAEKSSQISPTTLFETIVARPNSSDKTIETVDATSRTWSRKASRHPCLHLRSQPAPIRPNGLFRQKTGIRPSGRSIVTAFVPNTRQLVPSFEKPVAHPGSPTDSAGTSQEAPALKQINILQKQLCNRCSRISQLTFSGTHARNRPASKRCHP